MKIRGPCAASFWPVRFNRSRISKRTHATSFQISRAVVAAARQFDEAWICVKLWMTSVAVLKEEPAFIQSSLNWDLVNKEKPKSQQERSYRKSDYTGASRKPAVLFLITRIYETYEPDCSKYAKSGSIKHFLSASNAAQRPSRSSFCAIPASYLPVFWHTCRTRPVIIPRLDTRVYVASRIYYFLHRACEFVWLLSPKVYPRVDKAPALKPEQNVMK